MVASVDSGPPLGGPINGGPLGRLFTTFRTPIIQERSQFVTPFSICVTPEIFAIKLRSCMMF